MMLPNRNELHQHSGFRRPANKLRLRHRRARNAMRKSPLPLASDCLPSLRDLVYSQAVLSDRKHLRPFVHLPAAISVTVAHLSQNFAFAHAGQDSTTSWSSLDRCSSGEVASPCSGFAAEQELVAAAEERASRLRLLLPPLAVLVSDPEAGLGRFA